MLKHWQTHAEYQHFISDAVSHLNMSQRKKLQSYSDSIKKLTSLNLDPVGEFMAPFYSHTGRPALNQPQILRSFVLFMDLHCLSIDSWVKTLAQDDLLALLIGCSPDALPPLGSYYDFINRLWLRNPDFEKFGRKDTLPCDKNKKPSLKPGKDKKLPNKHSGVTKKAADWILCGRDFPFHYEKALQELFRLLLSSLLLTLGLFHPITLQFPVTVPVSTPIPIHMAKKRAIVPNMVLQTANAPGIFLIPMLPLAGTAASVRITMAIRSICFPAIMKSFTLTFHSTCVFWTQNVMTALADWSLLLNFTP